MAVYQVVSKGITRTYNTEGKMNKRTAIRACKKLWKEIKESGLSKEDFLNSPDGQKWLDKNYWADCPLCEYSEDDCSNCPLMTQYNKWCYNLGFHNTSISKPEFLEAIRGLK